MTAVWPDRRMSADFTSGSQMSEHTGISLGFQRRTRKPLPLFLTASIKAFSASGIWGILVNGVQMVDQKFGDKSLTGESGLSFCLSLIWIKFDPATLNWGIRQLADAFQIDKNNFFFFGKILNK